MTMPAPLALLLLALLCFFHSASANVWTVDCPIVFPGESPAGHVHAIVGGSKFSIDLTYEDTQQSQCTSCNAGDDLSNYWVPQLYVYKQADGKYHYVPMEFHIYYKLINDRGQTDPDNNPIVPGEFSAFPADFRPAPRSATTVCAARPPSPPAGTGSTLTRRTTGPAQTPTHMCHTLWAVTGRRVNAPRRTRCGCPLSSSRPSTRRRRFPSRRVMRSSTPSMTGSATDSTATSLTAGSLEW